jgi:hypothetical protein
MCLLQIPVIINRNSATSAGVPRAVYISFIVIMTCAAGLALFLLPAHKLRRDDGSVVAVDKARGPWEELKSNLLVFTDFKLLLMVPAFLPAECFLVYSGSVNGWSTISTDWVPLTLAQHSTTTCEHDPCSHLLRSWRRFHAAWACNGSWTTVDGVDESAHCSG